MNPSFNDTTLERRMVIRQAKFLLGLRMVIVHICFFSAYAIFLLIFSDLSDLKRMQVFLFLNLAELAVLFYAVLRWHNHFYLVRPDKILTSRGVFLRRQRYFALKNIESITVRQGVFGKILGFGSLQLYAPTLNDRINMFGINNPCLKQAIIERLLPTVSKSGRRSRDLFILPRDKH